MSIDPVVPSPLDLLKLPGRVALLFGGVSPEHEVSILSASQVTGALAELAMHSAPLKIDTVYLNKDGEWVWRAGDGVALTEKQILDAPKWDCQPEEHGVEIYSFVQGLEQLTVRRVETALFVLHGANGEDGRLQGALDLTGIAYTGSGALASAVCLNKPRCQAVLNAARLPIASSVVVHHDQQMDYAQIMEAIDLPCVIKPAQGGSSVGMTIVREAEELTAALECAFEIDDEALVEKFVPGREFTAGVLERTTGSGQSELISLPIVEIIPPEGRFYDYQAKYFDDATRYLVPAPIIDGLTSRMQNLALRGFRACGCRGFARVDFLCDANAGAEPTIIEVNTLPGMTSHSLLPKAAAAAGIDYASLVGFMLASARHD